MTKENALGLVPNELVGFRIRTDEHNFTLVLVKRHGATSKHAGQTYDTPLGYHKSLENAVAALIDKAIRFRAEGTAVDEDTNAEAWALRLKEAVEYAKSQAIEAVKAARGTK